MLSAEEENAVILLAARARDFAHAPYSGFRVGAVVIGEDNRTFYGCNVENASLGLSLCAERAALSAAVAAGVRRIRAIVVVSDSRPPCLPCGACLQWVAEFGDGGVQVISANPHGDIRRTVLRDLIKEPFRR